MGSFYFVQNQLLKQRCYIYSLDTTEKVRTVAIPVILIYMPHTRYIKMLKIYREKKVCDPRSKSSLAIAIKLTVKENFRNAAIFQLYILQK